MMTTDSAAPDPATPEPAGDGPRVRVLLRIVLPPELGGRVIEETVDLPTDHRIPGQGRGVEAMVDHVTRQAKAALRQAGATPHPYTGE